MYHSRKYRDNKNKEENSLRLMTPYTQTKEKWGVKEAMCTCRADCPGGMESPLSSGKHN